MRNPYAISEDLRDYTDPAPTTKWLLEHNAKQSGAFLTPEAKKNRDEYREKHPTLLGALKCIDGRLNLSLVTEVPLGIIQPFRNIGGKFDIGWPYFQTVLSEWFEYAHENRKDCILFVTYHYSKGDRMRGCKGFDYDTDAARKAAEDLRGRIRRIYSDVAAIRIGVIMLGVETDEDALVLHGSNGGILHLSGETETSTPRLMKKVSKLFPCLNEQMLHDFVPLVRGNVTHIKAVRKSGRSAIENEHCECCLGVGRGFDWLHVPNKALLIGGYSFDAGVPIVKAAGIILSNINEGRIKKTDGVVLMASALYWENGGLGVKKRLAIERAMSLAEFSLEKIKADPSVSPLLDYLSVVVGEVNMQTRLFKDRTTKFWEHRSVFRT